MTNVPSGLHRYTGNPAHLKLRLVFTSAALLAQRPRGVSPARAAAAAGISTSTRPATTTKASTSVAAAAEHKHELDELELRELWQRQRIRQDGEEHNSHKSKEAGDSGGSGGGGGVRGSFRRGQAINLRGTSPIAEPSAGFLEPLPAPPFGRHENDDMTNVQYQATYLLTQRPIDDDDDDDERYDDHLQLAADAKQDDDDDADEDEWTLIPERPQKRATGFGIGPLAGFAHDTADDKDNNNNNISNIYNTSDSVDDNEKRQQNDIIYYDKTNNNLATLLRRQGFEFRVVSVPSARPAGNSCQCCLNFRKETKAKRAGGSKLHHPNQDQDQDQDQNDDHEDDDEDEQEEEEDQYDLEEKSVPVKQYDKRKSSLIKSNVGERIVQSNATKLTTKTNRAKPVTDLSADFFLSSLSERVREQPPLAQGNGEGDGNRAGAKDVDAFASHLLSERLVQDDDLLALVVRREVGRDWHDMTLSMTSNNRSISDRPSDSRRAQAIELAATLAPNSASSLAPSRLGLHLDRLGRRRRRRRQDELQHELTNQFIRTNDSAGLLMRNHYLPISDRSNCSHLLLGAHCCHGSFGSSATQTTRNTSNLDGRRRKKSRDTAGFSASAGPEAAATCGAISFLCALCESAVAHGLGSGAKQAGAQLPTGAGRLACCHFCTKRSDFTCHCCRSCTEFAPAYRHWLKQQQQQQSGASEELLATSSPPGARSAGFECAQGAGHSDDEEATAAARRHEDRVKLERRKENVHEEDDEDDDDHLHREAKHKDDERKSPLNGCNHATISDQEPEEEQARFVSLLNELLQENRKISGVASANNGSTRSFSRDAQRREEGNAKSQLSMHYSMSAQQPLLDGQRQLAGWKRSVTAASNRSDKERKSPQPSLEATGSAKRSWPCCSGGCRSAHGETLLVIMEKYAPRDGRAEPHNETAPPSGSASSLFSARAERSSEPSGRRRRCAASGAQLIRKGANDDEERLNRQFEGKHEEAASEDDDDDDGAQLDEKSDRTRGLQSGLARSLDGAYGRSSEAEAVAPQRPSRGELLGADDGVSGHNGPSVKRTKPDGKGALIDSGNQDYADESEHADHGARSQSERRRRSSESGRRRSGSGASKGPSELADDGGDSGANGATTSNEPSATQQRQRTLMSNTMAAGDDSVVVVVVDGGNGSNSGGTARHGPLQKQAPQSRHRQRPRQGQATAHKSGAQGEREYAILLAAIVIDVFNRTVQVKPDLDKLIMLDMRALARHGQRRPAARGQPQAAWPQQIGANECPRRRRPAEGVNASDMDASLQQANCSLADLLLYHVEAVHEPDAAIAAERDLALARRQLKLIQQVATEQQQPQAATANDEAGFLSPINGSLLVNLQLDIHYVHELDDKTCRNAFVKYKLYARRHPSWSFRKRRESGLKMNSGASAINSNGRLPLSLTDAERQLTRGVAATPRRRQPAEADANARKLGQMSHAVAREVAWARRNLSANSNGEHVAAAAVAAARSDEIEDEDGRRWQGAVGKLDERRRLDDVRHDGRRDDATTLAAPTDLLLLLEGSTITSQPNSSGCFHLSCAEQILLEACRRSSTAGRRNPNDARAETRPAAMSGAGLAETPPRSISAEIMKQMSSAVADEADKRLDSTTAPIETQQQHLADGGRAGNVTFAFSTSASMTTELKDIAPTSSAIAVGAHDSMNSREPRTAPADENDVCQLVLVLELYSSDFFGDKLQGWTSLNVPISLERHEAPIVGFGNGAIAPAGAVNHQHGASVAASNKYPRTRSVELPVTGPAFCALLDRLRYHLIGQLPKAMPKVESLVMANNRYLAQSRPAGKLALSYAVSRQFSDHQFDSILRDLLEAEPKTT